MFLKLPIVAVTFIVVGMIVGAGVGYALWGTQNGNLQNQVNALSARRDTLSIQLIDHQNQIIDLQGQISALQSDRTNATIQITDYQNQIIALQASIDALSAQVLVLDAEIEALSHPIVGMFAAAQKTEPENERLVFGSFDPPTSPESLILQVEVTQGTGVPSMRTMSSTYQYSSQIINGTTGFGKSGQNFTGATGPIAACTQSDYAIRLYDIAADNAISIGDYLDIHLESRPQNESLVASDYAIKVTMINSRSGAVINYLTFSWTVEQPVIYWTTVAPKDMKAQLDAGLIEAGVGWEPYVSDALLANSADEIVWSGDIWPDHPCCTLVVKTSFLQSNPDFVARLVRADIDATVWMADAMAHPGSANHTALLNMGASLSGRSIVVVEAALQHIKYAYDITDAAKADLVDLTNMFVELGQTTDQTVHARGYATVTDFIDAVTDTSVVAAAMNVQPSLVILGSIKLGCIAGDLHQLAQVVARNATLFGGQSLFQKYGVNIESATSFANSASVMDAFATGSIDAGYLGVPAAILKRLNAAIDVTLVALVNNEGSAIIAERGITSLEDLVGKTVATPGVASIQHLLLLIYANQNGYTLKLRGT